MRAAQQNLGYFITTSGPRKIGFSGPSGAVSARPGTSGGGSGAVWGRLGPARHGSARPGPEQLGSARLGPARLGAARLGSAQLGFAPPLAPPGAKKVSKW